MFIFGSDICGYFSRGWINQKSVRFIAIIFFSRFFMGQPGRNHRQGVKTFFEKNLMRGESFFSRNEEAKDFFFQKMITQKKWKFKILFFKKTFFLRPKS